MADNYLEKRYEEYLKRKNGGETPMTIKKKREMKAIMEKKKSERAKK